MLFLIILILTYAAAFFMPWWVAVIIAFGAALLMGSRLPVASVKPWRSFWAGFFGVAVAWIILALCKSIPNDNILAGRVAVMFHLPGWIWLLAVTAIIGGLAGGMSALSGALVRKAFWE